MTYKKNIPDHVKERWIKLNPNYTIDFSLDSDCISFLEQHFNSYVARLFQTIPKGMYKADLWRLCKLYIEGGVYADVDLVPYVNIDSILEETTATFYSCKSIDSRSIFQAFMIVREKHSPLILAFLLSFLIVNPYKRHNGPTYDMYNCLSRAISSPRIESEKYYMFSSIPIEISIPWSSTNKVSIPLHYFPSDVHYTIKGETNLYSYHIRDHQLEVESNYVIKNHICTIILSCKEEIYLFPEKKGDHWYDSYVTNGKNKILDSRDIRYFKNKGW